MVIVAFISTAKAQQTLTLKQAIDAAIKNYGTVKAKLAYAAASVASSEQARREYFPNVVLSGQQTYGTVNGQNGPLYGFGGYAASSSGLPLAAQNWNAAFGSLYLANINWDVFAFGRAIERIRTAEQVANRDRYEAEQEIFQHKVKVASTYLNLLAAQKLSLSFLKNLSRADTFKKVVVTRALNGLTPGVDTAQANAELSNARIAYTNAKDHEQEQSNQLAVLLGVQPREFILDTLFISKVPGEVLNSSYSNIQGHPTLKWYKSRWDLSDEQVKYYKTFYYPTISLVGVYQMRGSGFGSDYAINQQSFTHRYLDGIQPSRMNYLFGIGVVWNLTQPFRMHKQVQAQRLTSSGLQHEYDLAAQQLDAQLTLSGIKIKNALSNYMEAPIQVEAASDAFLQRSVLYKNGLTNLVDVTQALYLLVRAETDRDIAYNNVWQALLLKAAASGDFSLFLNELD